MCFLRQAADFTELQFLHLLQWGNKRCFRRFLARIQCKTPNKGCCRLSSFWSRFWVYLSVDVLGNAPGAKTSVEGKKKEQKGQKEMLQWAPTVDLADLMRTPELTWPDTAVWQWAETARYLSHTHQSVNRDGKLREEHDLGWGGSLQPTKSLKGQTAFLAARWQTP